MNAIQLNWLLILVTMHCIIICILSDFIYSPFTIRYDKYHWKRSQDALNSNCDVFSLTRLIVSLLALCNGLSQVVAQQSLSSKSLKQLSFSSLSEWERERERERKRERKGEHKGQSSWPAIPVSLPRQLVLLTRLYRRSDTYIHVKCSPSLTLSCCWIWLEIYVF